MKVFPLIASLAMAGLVAACGTTPPSTYYMLSADAEGVPGESGISIGVGPVTIPDYLKERSMVLARDDHRLQVSEFDRWAEPLEAGITRVLILNLAVLTDSQKVQAFPWRSDGVPDYGLRVSVVQLNILDDVARLAVSWTLRHARDDKLIYQALSQLEAPVRDNEPETVAEIYSSLLLALSEEIARVISQDAQHIEVSVHFDDALY